MPILDEMPVAEIAGSKKTEGSIYIFPIAASKEEVLKVYVTPKNISVYLKSSY